ncbi:hypothetical protein ACQB60_34800 [Actinomycetota bacterium Odt1-20B]
MSSLLSLLAATTAAALSTLVGVFAGSAVSRRSQDRHWAREQQAAACAGVLRESTIVLMELGSSNASRSVDWRPWNEALSMVNLVADRDVVEAVHALDEQFWRAFIAVNRGPNPSESWLTLRSRVEAAQRDFVAVARQRLSSAGEQLQRLSGRPAPDDPIWDVQRD